MCKVLYGSHARQPSAEPPTFGCLLRKGLALPFPLLHPCCLWLSPALHWVLCVSVPLPLGRASIASAACALEAVTPLCPFSISLLPADQDLQLPCPVVCPQALKTKTSNCESIRVGVWTFQTLQRKQNTSLMTVNDLQVAFFLCRGLNQWFLWWGPKCWTTWETSIPAGVHRWSYNCWKSLGHPG